MSHRPDNLVTLAELLPIAERNGYAVGSFTPRSLLLIRPILESAEDRKSPIIIMVAYREAMGRGMAIDGFAKEFYRCVKDDGITVPVCLHLDHTMEFEQIKAAVEAGFTSVMIDASQQELRENIRITKLVSDYVKKFHVSAEGELGRILSHGYEETMEDEELYTDPQEAGIFVDETGVDALAVSVGTQHGVYNKIKNATIDFQRLQRIKDRVRRSIVLHGGSGISDTMIRRAIQLKGGGVSKINIATEVEQVFLNAIGSEKVLSHPQIAELPLALLTRGQCAVFEMVRGKIDNFLLSGGRTSIEGGRRA
jgi:ketose-bisphosphate aldolase